MRNTRNSSTWPFNRARSAIRKGKSSFKSSAWTGNRCLLQLLKSLERQQRSMGIVLDEFGGTPGMVTIEDILQEVLGRMPQELEAGGFVMESLGPGRWRVNGTARVNDFRREHPEL